MTGEIISHYRILEKLGDGGLGVVYAAEDTNMGRRVAVKFLPEDVTQDTLALERLKHQVQVASSLNHPHICGVYGIDEYEGKLFTIMELLEGETLRQLLAWQSGKDAGGNANIAGGEGSEKLRTTRLGAPGAARLPLNTLLDFAVQIADALDFAHFKGIIHTNIHPANVFIIGGGQTKLMDFGLSRIPGCGAPAVTAYMSPEQARGEELNARTDLFSLGAVLYEMAAGRQAFAGDRPEMIVDAISRSTPISVADLDRRLPPRLSEIIDRLLEKNRDRRYHSAMELRTDLKFLQAESGSGSAGATHRPKAAIAGRRATSSRRRARKRFQRRVAIGSVALAGILGVLIVLFATHRVPHLPRPAKPVQRTQISHWNRPMNEARLSPTGKTVAFGSPAQGVDQVFAMPMPDGDPVQLTQDEGDKYVDGFAPDGTEIYYGSALGEDQEWAVPTSGGTSQRIAPGRRLAPSPDGDGLFFLKSDSRAVYRAAKSGLGVQMVYSFQDPPLVPWSILPFPDGLNLLVTAVARPGDDQVHLFKVNVPTRQAADGGVLSGAPAGGIWVDPGRSLMFSRTVSGLTNLWEYDLEDRTWTQVTFGPGPDTSPMPDPAGKGIYYVSGKVDLYFVASAP